MTDSRKPDARGALEADIRQRFDAGDLEGATTLAIRGFGPEIYGFIASIVRSESDAADVFGQFCEEVWKSFARFEWQCAFRTWAYTLARRTAFHYVRSPIRRVGRNVPLSRASAVERAEAEVRSHTATFLRTEVKDKVARIREQLDPDDRLLLVLRVDKQLGWNEVAHVFLEDDAPSADVLKRESARLRKRFELVKAKILELGRAQGIGRGET
jgi:RNA polymerase sigma-70 factor (ECF subfamily)